MYGSLASASYHAQMQRFLKGPPDSTDTTTQAVGGGLSLNLDPDLIDAYGHVSIMRWEVRFRGSGMGEVEKQGVVVCSFSLLQLLLLWFRNYKDIEGR